MNKFLEKINIFFADDGIITKIVSSLIIFVVCMIVLRLVETFINRAVKKKSDHIDPRRQKTLSSVLKWLIRYLVYFFAFFNIVQVFTGKGASFILAITGFLSVAVGLGAQSFIKDIINGVFILIENQYSIGDLVSIGDNEGVVELVNLRVSHIRTADSELVIIPNGSIATVRNFSKEFSNAICRISIPFDQNLERALSVVDDEAKISSKTIKNLTSPIKFVGIINLDGKITILIKANCEINKNYETSRELSRNMIKRFQEEKIRMV